MVRVLFILLLVGLRIPLLKRLSYLINLMNKFFGKIQFYLKNGVEGFLIVS